MLKDPLLTTDPPLSSHKFEAANVYGINLVLCVNRFATYDATAECLRSLGVIHASPLLEALSFHHHPSKRICLRELVAALQEEMNAGLENGLLANSGPSGAALHAGVLLMQHELSSVR